jgi:hypothetical protein
MEIVLQESVLCTFIHSIINHRVKMNLSGGSDSLITYYNIRNF